MITIKKNTAPDIETIKFECDNEIHKRLNQFELARDFLNKSNTTIFIGRQGSGKTSLMVNMVKKLYKKCFHQVFVFMPHSSRKSLHNNIFDKHLDPTQIYEELNEANINELYAKLKSNSEDGYRSLVIFDDVQKALKDHSVLQSLKKYYSKSTPFESM